MHQNNGSGKILNQIYPGKFALDFQEHKELKNLTWVLFLTSLLLPF